MNRIQGWRGWCPTGGLKVGSVLEPAAGLVDPKLEGIVTQLEASRLGDQLTSTDGGPSRLLLRQPTSQLRFLDRRYSVGQDNYEPVI